MTLAEGKSGTAVNDRWPTVDVLAVVDFTWRLWTRGSGTNGGGLVGEVEGYLWMRRLSADATREEAAAVGGGAMRKRKWCASLSII